MTVITITHHMNEAIEADRVCVMDHGRIIADGTPYEVFSDVEKMRAARLTVPQVTELMYLLKKAGKNCETNVLHAMEAADMTEGLFR